MQNVWVKLCILVLFISTAATAAMHELPSSFISAALSENSDLALNQSFLDDTEVSLEWENPQKAISGVRLSLFPNTIEWVRVAEFVVIARARAKIDLGAGVSGIVRVAGINFPIHGVGEVPIALVAGTSGKISITAYGKTASAMVHFRASAATKNKERIAVDPSCSAFGVNAKMVFGASSGDNILFAHIGCRVVHTKNSENGTTSLELFVYWNDVGEEVAIDTQSVPSTRESFWLVRVKPGAGELNLKSTRGDELKIGYFSAEVDHYAHLGLGIGPYTYTFEGGGKNTHAWAPLATIYGSYYLADDMRIVAFDALPIHSNIFTDFGLYVSTQSFRAIDNRLIMNIMLGAHALVFSAHGSTFVRPSGPQGVEVIFKDAFFKRNNMSLGVFFYPLFSDTSYANIWLRASFGRIFIEGNYISWRDTIGAGSDEKLFSRALGVSFGFPIFDFL